MVHRVVKQENWMSYLIKAVKAARKGDIVLVDNVEMLGYADMGLKSRGLITHSREHGVVVHISDGTRPEGAYLSYGPQIDTNMVRSMFPKDQAQAVAQQEAFADAYGDAKQAAEAAAKAAFESGQPVLFTMQGPVTGVPNANGDVFTAEGWGQAMKEYMEKVKTGELKPAVIAIDSISPGPVTVTTVKPTQEQIDAHQSSMKKLGKYPDLLDTVMRRPFYRYLGTESGRWMSQDLTYQPPFFAVVIKAHAPSGAISVLDRDGKEIPFNKVSKNLLMIAAAFARNPRAFLEEEERLKNENKDNPCRAEDYLPPYSPKDVVHTTSMHRKIQRAKMEWGKKPWKYVKLDGTVEAEVDADAVELALRASKTYPNDDAIWEAMNKAYRTQTAITLTWKSPVTETLVVPPDLYPASQKFMCQWCCKEYVYGESKKAFGKDRMQKDTLCFCDQKCRDAYLTKNRRYPGVGAEILLTPPQPCVPFGPQGGPDFKKQVDSVGQLFAVDDVAKFFGVEPAYVVHDSATFDVPQGKVAEFVEKVLNKPVEDEKMKQEEEFRRGMEDGENGRPFSPSET